MSALKLPITYPCKSRLTNSNPISCKKSSASLFLFWGNTAELAVMAITLSPSASYPAFNKRAESTPPENATATFSRDFNLKTQKTPPDEPEARNNPLFAERLHFRYIFARDFKLKRKKTPPDEPEA